MIEEVKTEEKIEDKTTDYEKEASEKGWKPLEEWDGPKELHVDAKTYLDRGPFIQQIVKQRKEIEEMKKAVSAMGEFMTKAERAGYEKAQKELLAQHEQAIVDGDVKKGKEVLKQLQELTPVAESKPLPQEPDVFSKWKEANPWFVKPKSVEDVEKREFAIKMSNAYVLINPNGTPEGETEFINAELEKKFPKQEREETNKVPAVTGIAPKKAKSSEADEHPLWHKLTDQQKQLAKTFVSMGAFKKTRDYVESLVQSGVVK